MTTKILCVDDEPNILSGYQRSLRKQFQIDVAEGGTEALAKMESSGSYAVIVTDMRMPGMDGIQFLKEVQQKSPDSVRIMLTGNADQATATEAVNEGHIFRFLNKPCPPEELAQALTAGLEQYRLITAEKELLEKTLGGAIRVLMEILAMVDPDLFGRAQTLRHYMRRLAVPLQSAGLLTADDLWSLDLAALLAQIGVVTVPPFLVSKVRTGTALTEAERTLWRRVPETGYGLLRNIPRLEPVAQIVRYQHKDYDSDSPITGKMIPCGARMLRVLLDLMEVESGIGVTRSGAFSFMQRQTGRYDPEILAAARRCLIETEPIAIETPAIALSLTDVCPGQTLAKDVQTADGKVVLTAGRRLSEVLLEKLRNYAALSGIQEPVYVHRAD